jgi:hypothetical protein
MGIEKKADSKDRNRKAISGVDEHLASTASLMLNGVAFTPATLKAVLQKGIDAANAADLARAAWQKTVADGRAAQAEASSVLRALRGYLVAVHGGGAVDLLADFGFKPPKSTKVPVQTKAEAVAKTAATRAARHTMGPKQKKNVKGTTSPAAASTPSALAPVSPAPSASAPSTGASGGAAPHGT